MTNIGYLILQTLAAAAGTVGFSLLFGVPVRYFCHCGLIEMCIRDRWIPLTFRL